jgi:hypothetical protein
VLGPTVNGKQTYIDSVMIVTNTAFDMLNAKVSKEDSSYTMLAPTNEAWVAQYNKVKKYFNYIATTSAQDIDEATSTSSAPTSTVTIEHTEVGCYLQVRVNLFSKSIVCNRECESTNSNSINLIRIVFYLLIQFHCLQLTLCVTVAKSEVKLIRLTEYITISIYAIIFAWC